MPARSLASRVLGTLLGVLSHPNRIRIIEELRDGPRDVSTLQQALGISHSGVSQHLAVLRAHRLVTEQREGRHVYYRLRIPALAQWLVEGMAFLEETPEDAEVRGAIDQARRLWGDGGEPEG